MTSFRIKEPVFKTEPLFLLGCSAKAAEKLLWKRYRMRVSLGDRNTMGTMLTRNRRPWRVIWMKHYPDTPARVGVLMHELLHLVVRICGDKGVPVVSHFETGQCGDETAAYLFEFFAVKCLRKIRRKSKR